MCVRFATVYSLYNSNAMRLIVTFEKDSNLNNCHFHVIAIMSINYIFNLFLVIIGVVQIQSL